MFASAVRRLAVSGALAVLALAFAAAGARASGITASAISSPGANSYFFYDQGAASSTLFTVSGTTTGSGNIDINCYGGDGSFTTFPLVSNWTVTGNTFDVPITLAEVLAAKITEPCVLRAVDTGDSTPYPPGYTVPFTGPSVALGDRDLSATVAGTVYDFRDLVAGFAGGMTITSAGNCGLESARLYSSDTLIPSPRAFICTGALFATEPIQGAVSLQGEITVDGQDARDSRAANYGLPGYEGITVSDSFAAGNWTIHDDEPLLLCTPNCPGATSYTPSGVELDRTWQTAADGTLALQTDVFRSVDGRQHTILALEDDDTGSVGSPTGASFLFPGSSGFQDYALAATVSLPTGPGTIEFKTDAATPDGGDQTNPQGAIVYASPPNAAAVTFTYSDGGSSGYTPEFVLPYSRTIPPGGSIALRFGYVLAYDLPTVRGLAQTVLNSFAPGLSIAGPTGGATVTTSPLTVTGSASDVAGIASVTVNGRIATVGADGSYSVPVTLTPGTNALTVIATDNDGITTQKQVTVFYQALPTASTGVASGVTATTARIAGTVDPDGVATTHAVQYGATTAYGSRTADTDAGAGTVATPVSTVVTGLKPGTRYHYRVTATNASGTSDGTDRTFTTAKPAPTGLGAKVTPRKATRFPYRYSLTGKLSLPKGVTPGRGCSGRITVTVRRAKKTVATARATVTKRCAWRTAVTVTQRRKVPGHGRLTFTPAFGGNRALGAVTARPLTAAYG